MTNQVVPTPAEGSEVSGTSGVDAPAAGGIEVHYRRAPRFTPFVVSGVVLGVVVGLVICTFGTVPPDYSRASVWGFFGAVFGLLGGLLGGAVAVLVERRH